MIENHELEHEIIGLDEKIRDIVIQSAPVGGGGGEGGEGINSEVDPFSLHLDQTVQQTIVNGTPIFNKGLIIKAGESIYFDGE